MAATRTKGRPNEPATAAERALFSQTQRAQWMGFLRRTMSKIQSAASLEAAQALARRTDAEQYVAETEADLYNPAVETKVTVLDTGGRPRIKKRRLTSAQRVTRWRDRERREEVVLLAGFVKVMRAMSLDGAQEAATTAINEIESIGVMTHKTCRACDEVKPVEDFDDRRRVCRVCYPEWRKFRPGGSAYQSVAARS